MHPSGASSGDRPAGPEVVAAVDIGTNSVHMVVARSAAAGPFEVLTRHKEVVRLGSGLDDMSELGADAIDRGVAALRRCSEIAAGFDAEIRAVATSAVREASNAAVFTERVRDEAGVEVSVIAGVEEARLIQLGVLQALPVFDKTMLLVDVGGGSTEVLIGRGPEVLFARSLKLGAIRMTRRFFSESSSAKGVVTKGAVQRCRSFVQARLAAAAHEAAPLDHEVAVACSGTAETLIGMAFAKRGVEAPSSVNQQVLTRKQLGKVISDLVDAGNTEERSKLPGMDPSRADILLGGALVLEGVCDAFGVTSLTFSDYALREGVLLDTFARRRGGAMHHLSDLRRASVMHLLEVCDDDPEHAVRVARHALELHDLLGARLGLGDHDREVLEAAALLANVGLFISHSSHHKHSYYVIRNAEHLTGFTDEEKELIAQVARYHRKGDPSVVKHPEFAALPEAERERVRSMAALLRVAIALDRNHDGGVRCVSLGAPSEDSAGERADSSADDGTTTLVVHPEGDRSLELELFSAADRSSLLAERLGAPVRFTQSD